jgi:hypothetical protein
MDSGLAVEKRIAYFACIAMAASDGTEVIEAIRFDPVPVAIELVARVRLRRAVPGANELHEEPDGERPQHDVRPYHLRPRARLPVLPGFARDALLGPPPHPVLIQQLERYLER